MSKLLLYVCIIPFIIWMLDGLEINKIFKKNRVVQARLFYLVITFILSYLIVNFLFDFLNASIIK